MHQTCWTVQTFSRRALGMPVSIVEMGDDAGSEILWSDFVGVVGISDWPDSLTACSAFSIRRLQLNRFLDFSGNNILKYVKRYHSHAFNIITLKKHVWDDSKVSSSSCHKSYLWLWIHKRCLDFRSFWLQWENWR